MARIKSLGFRIIATAILGLSLIGCGGGGSSGNGGTTTAVTKTGTFVDSPVEGLKYETPTLSGFTDGKGNFQYKDGEIITFKIGNLELGSAKGGTLMTPLTLTNESDLNNISSKATNIARILQSLDENSSNSGLIKIPSSLKDLNVSSINLESDADLGTILTKAQTITSKAYILKDSTTAKADMKKYIGLYNKYEIISAGYYSGIGTKWYLLTMPTDGNLVADSTYGRLTTDVYDINLATITDENGNEIHSITGFKKAGQYIIKVEYGSYGDELTINSPVLFNQNNLSPMTSGTYSGTGTKWYLLTMPTDGNLVADSTYGRLTTDVYDINLATITDENGNEIHSITGFKKAGQYIIKVEYGSYGDELTINSPVLN